jgi:hypothetical protein
MPTEPTPEELRARLEQSFERWRQRLDEASTSDDDHAEASVDDDDTNDAA